MLNSIKRDIETLDEIFGVIDEGYVILGQAQHCKSDPPSHQRSNITTIKLNGNTATYVVFQRISSQFDDDPADDGEDWREIGKQDYDLTDINELVEVRDILEHARFKAIVGL